MVCMSRSIENFDNVAIALSKFRIVETLQLQTPVRVNFSVSRGCAVS
jgi:hypothetical protein